MRCGLHEVGRKNDKLVMKARWRKKCTSLGVWPMPFAKVTYMCRATTSRSLNLASHDPDSSTPRERDTRAGAGDWPHPVNADSLKEWLMMGEVRTWD